MGDALRFYGFTVEHKPGKLHVVRGTPSRIFAFQLQQEMALPSLAPICRNVPDESQVQTARLPHP